MFEAARRTTQPKWWWSCPPQRRRNYEWATEHMKGMVRAATALAEKKVETKGGEEDLVNMCVQMKQARDSDHGFDDLDLADEAVTLLAAGHETTSNTLSWTLLLLSQNPHVLVKLRAELDQKVAGIIPTYDEARQLTYARAIVYETLRLYPTVPQFPRVAAYDTTLLSYDVPKGSFVFISQPSMNHNSNLWAEAEKISTRTLFRE